MNIEDLMKVEVTSVSRHEQSLSQTAAAVFVITEEDLLGLTATSILRQREQGSSKHQVVIALTAHAMKSDEGRCLAAGMDGYLAKPIRPQELDEILTRRLAPVRFRTTRPWPLSLPRPRPDSSASSSPRRSRLRCFAIHRATG